jgi:hypothetical protein
MICYDSSQRISSLKLEFNPLLLKYNASVEKKMIDYIQALHTVLENSKKEFNELQLN